MKAGTLVHDPVSGLDLFATILDYLNVLAPARDGASLRPLVQGKSAADYRVSEWGVRNQPSFMVRTRDWKLILADMPQSPAIDALYDLKNDPFEMRNLLGEPADRAKSAPRAEEMKDRLLAWLVRVHSPVVDSVKARKLSLV